MKPDFGPARAVRQYRLEVSEAGVPVTCELIQSGTVIEPPEGAEMFELPGGAARWWIEWEAEPGEEDAT